MTVTDETSAISFLLSGWVLLVALVAFYVGRSLWIARREWPECATDTKVLYLIVAPPLTLAVDVLEVTDRMFWRRSARRAQARRAGSHRGQQRDMQLARAQSPRAASARMTSKPAMRSNG